MMQEPFQFHYLRSKLESFTSVAHVRTDGSIDASRDQPQYAQGNADDRQCLLRRVFHTENAEHNTDNGKRRAADRYEPGTQVITPITSEAIDMIRSFPPEAGAGEGVTGCDSMITFSF